MGHSVEHLTTCDETTTVLSPQAQAYALLQGIHFGPDLDRSYHLDRSYYRAGAHPRPHIQFHWTGGDRFIRWVTASDLVALSLLQARLMDLGKPIKVVEGDWCGDTVRSRSDHCAALVARSMLL